MLKPTITEIEPGRVLHYGFEPSEARLTYRDVLKSWLDNSKFRRGFNALLAEAPFEAFRWETPPVCEQSLDRAFEFVLINTPGFANRATDTTSFSDQFATPNNPAVVSFDNLRGDAALVVPTPQVPDHDVYNHLAVFLRRAPQSQADALWLVTAARMLELITQRTVWLSTAGGGVAWLHVRLDSTPKYYGYGPFRSRPANR